MRSLVLISIIFVVYPSGLPAQGWQSLTERYLAFFDQGNYEKASEFAEKALLEIEEGFGKRSENYITTQNNLALIYQELGLFNKALSLYQEALESIELTYGKKHESYTTGLNNLGGLYKILGEYDFAKALYLEALNNITEKYGKNHPDYSRTLNNLAGVYQDTGNYVQALSCYLEAAERTKESHGARDPNYIIYSNNLAQLYRLLGQYKDALPIAIHVLNITKEKFSEGHPDYGLYLNNLAALYSDMGQYQKAVMLFLEALENCEKNFGKIHPAYGETLSNLGLLYMDMRQYEKAIPLFQEALEITKKNFGEEHPEYGLRLNGLGSALDFVGRWQEAQPLYLQALENIRKTLGVGHLAYGVCLSNLGVLFEATGQYDQALPLYLEAIEIVNQSLGKNHPNNQVILDNLAVLYDKMGQKTKALSVTNQSIEHVYSQLSNSFSFMSEKEKEQFEFKIRHTIQSTLSLFLTYSAEKPEVAANAFDAELATKGMILQSGVQVRQAILNSEDAKALSKYDEWITCRSLLAKQYALPLKYQRSDIKDIEKKAEDIEIELTRLSSTLKRVSHLNSTVTWRDIQKGLKKDEAAVEFSSFKYRSKKNWTDSTIYVALVLRKEDIHPKLVYLCEQRQLDSLFHRLPGNDAGFIAGLYRGGEAVIQSTPASGEKLYDLVWRPIDNLLSDVRTIYFAPSGSLYQVAFSAIPVNDTKLLSDQYQLRQLSTTANLIQAPAASQHSTSSISLFGGIQYDLTQKEIASNAGNRVLIDAHFVSRSLSEELDRGNLSWNYLPGTLHEVNRIVALAEEKKINTQLKTGRNATEETFKQLAGKNSPQILHISTHGFFFPDPKKEQPKDFISPREEKHVFRSSDNPLQRAGLLFAGSNNAWRGEQLPQGIDDGILTAYEVTNVTLSNTQLVVLSACETALGDIKGSEGVFGLQRAFKAAGAEYLMMSLWKVPDHETAEFMEFFYKQYFAGKNIPDAFHETQTHMKKRYPNDPYKWAAFVLVR